MSDAYYPTSEAYMRREVLTDYMGGSRDDDGHDAPSNVSEANDGAYEWANEIAVTSDSMTAKGMEYTLHELDPITYLHAGAMLQLELVAEIDIDVQLVSSIGNISPDLPTCDARVLWTQEDCLPLSFPTTNLVVDNLLYDNFEAGCTPIIGLGVSSVCDRRGCHILDVVASSKDRPCALTSPFFHMGGFCNSSPEVSYCNDYPDGYSDDRHDKFPDEQVAKCTSPYEEPVFSNAGPWAAAALFPANWATAPLYKRLIIEREELEKNIRLWEETLQSLQAKTTNSSNVEGFGPSPDFPYFPSSEAYQKESKRFQKQAQSVRSLPEGFPQAIVSPLAWKTKSPAIKQDKESWTLKLTEEQLKSIGAAVQQYEASGRNLEDLSPATFKLYPSTEDHLRDATKTMYDGISLMLIKGINPQQYSAQQNMIVQTGLSNYFGNLRSYNSPKGNDVVGLTHVRDLRTFFPKSDIASPTFTNKALTIHTDYLNL